MALSTLFGSILCLFTSLRVLCTDIRIICSYVSCTIRCLTVLRCPVEPLEWGDLDARVVAHLTADSAPDLVIGADIFYNSTGACLHLAHRGSHSRSADFEDLFATIRHLMELNPRLVVWTTYQNRRYMLFFS